MKITGNITRFATVGTLVAFLTVPMIGRSEENSAVTFSGQAIVGALTNTLNGAEPIFFGDTGALPATGGTLEVRLPFTNIMDALFFTSAKAKTSGDDGAAQAQVALNGFAMLLTNVAGD